MIAPFQQKANSNTNTKSNAYSAVFSANAHCQFCTDSAMQRGAKYPF